MNLIGLFSLAWVFLSCNQEEGKDNPAVPFRIMVKYWPFPVRKGMDGMPQAAERVKCIK